MASRKVFPGRQFTAKNLSRPSEFFWSVGGNFSGGDPIMGHRTFYRLKSAVYVCFARLYNRHNRAISPFTESLQGKSTPSPLIDVRNNHSITQTAACHFVHAVSAVLRRESCNYSVFVDKCQRSIHCYC